MIFYKKESHIYLFVKRLRFFTRRPVFTVDFSQACDMKTGTHVKDCIEIDANLPFSDPLNAFYAVCCSDSGKEMLYEGVCDTKGHPCLTDRPDCAEFYLDCEAAEDAEAHLREKGCKKLEVRKIYMDFENRLSEALFIIACEDKANGSMWFYEATKNNRTIVSRFSDKAKRLGFRDCLKAVGTLRKTDKEYLYSMLPNDIFDINIQGDKLMDYLRRTRPVTGISLNFKKS